MDRLPGEYLRRFRYVAAMSGSLAALILAGADAPAAAKSGASIMPPSWPSIAPAPSGDVLVALEHGVDAAPILASGGGTLLSRPLRLWRVPGARAALVVSRLRSANALRYVEPDVPVMLATHSRGSRGADTARLVDPLVSEQWYLRPIRARAAAPPGPGVPLIVVDDGLDPAHPELAARQLKLLNPRAQRADSHFHGTAITSVAAAAVNGVGIVGVHPRARLWYWDLARDFPSCGDAVQGVEAVSRRPRRAVITMSWGLLEHECFALYEALHRAFGRGYLLVAAAGNEREFGSPRLVPGGVSHVLTIAATDKDNRPTFFSSRGLGIDLAAPGASILAAVPTSEDPSGYASLDGTSFSAPMVSAAATEVWTRRPKLDVTQMFELMRRSARDIGPRGWDRNTGFGLLNLRQALRRPSPPSDPLEPNDDIYEVRPNGLKRTPSRALTRPGKKRATTRASLDWSEDPVDVYRAYVPARHRLSVRLAPTANVDLEVFSTGTRTVFYEDRAAAQAAGELIAFSSRSGRAVERLTIENRNRTGRYVYVVGYVPAGQALRARYTMKLEASPL